MAGAADEASGSLGLPLGVKNHQILDACECVEGGVGVFCLLLGRAPEIQGGGIRLSHPPSRQLSPPTYRPLSTATVSSNSS